MKANELRIGNYVLAPKSDEFDLRVCKVFEIRNKYFRLIELSTNLMFDQNRFEPIPLTEKWLTNFGFDSKQSDPDNCNNNFTKTDNPQYWIQHHTEVNEFIFYGMDNSIDKVLTSVHQLQNVYFALTGTELTIQP